jgi:CBS domain containing-hemolysin-like protein
MSVGHALHQAEHIVHSKHHGDDHGSNKFGTYIGVTMAILGVLLALCSALVGSERTKLVQQLVAQQNAHAKYQAQDVKHRVAFLSLTQVHATAFTGAAGAATAVNKADVLSLVNSVKRYLTESAMAKEWTNAYDATIAAHMHAQEEFEHGLLLSEIGIVIASIALLMQRRLPWIFSIILAAACIFVLVKTQLHVSAEVKAATAKITSTQAKYEATRKENKTTDAEEALVKEMSEWANAMPVAK